MYEPEKFGNSIDVFGPFFVVPCRRDIDSSCLVEIESLVVAIIRPVTLMITDNLVSKSNKDLIASLIPRNV